MFGFLKNQLKKIIPGLSEKFEQEAEPVKVEDIPEEEKGLSQKEPTLADLADKRKERKELEEKAERDIKKLIGEKEEKKTIIQKIKEGITKQRELITTVALSENKFKDIFWDLELLLLENNVAVEIIEKIKHNLKEKLVDTRIKRNDIEKVINDTLKETISSLFSIERVNFIDKIKSKKPFVISFVGINGSGKTTSIAKIANLLKKNNLKSVLAASDTFRAAAIDQLQQHADNLGLKMIKYDYGADAAAVAFDAIEYAKAHNIDAVLIDTAGRLHSNVNLMDELKKLNRVANPDLTIFVGESITGNDCVEQAKEFNNLVGIDGIILSKADVDEKGGAAISISYITGKPILFLGNGQEYDDLEEFDREKILVELGLY